MMPANSISMHAIERFRERNNGGSYATIRRKITGLLYSSKEVRRISGSQPSDTSKYFAVDGLVFVVKDGVVVTALFEKNDWRPV